MDSRIRASLFSPISMVAVALLIRLAVIWFWNPYQFYSEDNHFGFGYEMGRVARSIASGQGFANPYRFGATGPTAILGPIYPLLLAGVFKLFGIYTKASALAILTLDSLFSALTCAVVCKIGQKSFGTNVGICAGWAWAFYPYAIYFCARWVWESSLSAFLLSLLLLTTLNLGNSLRAPLWLCFGLLWGLASLTSPALTSIMPFILVWLVYQHRQKWGSCVRLAAASMLIFFLTLTPWTVRNSLAFGQFVPVRSDFGANLLNGNTGDLKEYTWNHAFGPNENREDLARASRLGEAGYMAEVQREAVRFVMDHPASYVRLIMRRIVFIWTGAWNLKTIHSVSQMVQLAPTAFFALVSLLAFYGLWLALRERKEDAVPYLIILLIFPLVYYLTLVMFRYRHPIDPVIVLLATYATLSMLPKLARTIHWNSRQRNANV